MQGSIPSYPSIEDNITTRPVHVSSYLDGTELIHNDERPVKATIVKPTSLAKLKLMHNARNDPHMTKSLRYLAFKENEQYQDEIAKIEDMNNKIVFSLVHNWTDQRQDNLAKRQLYGDEDLYMPTYEEILDSKIQKLLVQKERINNRKLLITMSSTLKRPPMPPPRMGTKRQLHLMLRYERELNLVDSQ